MSSNEGRVRVSKVEFENHRRHHEIAKAYKNVFDELANSTRYRTYGVAEFYLDRDLVVDEERVNVVLRIDVDSCLHLEPELARILRDYDIHSSHYFLTFPERYYALWGSGIPKLVNDCGHEVGLHSDHYYEELLHDVDALERLREDVKRLSWEAGAPVRGMCFHGHEKIERLGKSNWDLTKDLHPKEVGLEYHDGRKSKYLKPGSRGWKPNCDAMISDYMGVKGHWGWNHSPRMPIQILRNAKPGDVVHIVMHTKNAFKYWENWDGRFGEMRIERPGVVEYVQKTLFIWLRQHRLLPKHLKDRSLQMSVSIIMRLPALMAKGTFWSLCRIWPRSSEEEPDTTWEHARQRIFSRDIRYWYEQLEKFKLTAEGSRVLEIGSGNGQWLLAFAETADYVIGVEPEGRFREFTAKKISEFPKSAQRIGLVGGVAERLPIATGSMDVVLCAGVLMFTRQHDAVDEISRVLRAGGRAGIIVNGAGYFCEYLINGLRYRNRAKLEYGYKGLLFSLVAVITGRQLTPCAMWPRRMRRLLARQKIVIEECRSWRAREGLPPTCLGFATNYVFIVRKAV